MQPFNRPTTQTGFTHEPIEQGTLHPGEMPANLLRGHNISSLLDGTPSTSQSPPIGTTNGGFDQQAHFLRLQCPVMLFRHYLDACHVLHWILSHPLLLDHPIAEGVERDQVLVPGRIREPTFLFQFHQAASDGIGRHLNPRNQVACFDHLVDPPHHRRSVPFTPLGLNMPLVVSDVFGQRAAGFDHERILVCINHAFAAEGGIAQVLCQNPLRRRLVRRPRGPFLATTIVIEPLSDPRPIGGLLEQRALSIAAFTLCHFVSVLSMFSSPPSGRCRSQ
ncbi:MAG: hypothetical protein WD768_12685 [Phycisphaeraceae bacterium]